MSTPTTETLVACVGVPVPICTVLSEHGLPIAPSTYDEQVRKAPTGRDRRDAMLINEIRRVHAG